MDAIRQAIEDEIFERRLFSNTVATPEEKKKRLARLKDNVGGISEPQTSRFITWSNGIKVNPSYGNILPSERFMKSKHTL